jgi:hypothetical protein
LSTVSTLTGPRHRRHPGIELWIVTAEQEVRHLNAEPLEQRGRYAHNIETRSLIVLAHVGLRIWLSQRHDDGDPTLLVAVPLAFAYGLK